MSTNKLVGKYLLGKQLGSGAYSVVVQCTDTETNIKYAMKMIEKQKIHKERIEHHMRREIAFTKALQHENIVGFVEAMQTTDHVYLVLELVSGGELLDKIITQKRFDEDTARKYFRQLICGVQYCHEHGVAHRDLKPENLLLDRNGRLKISDFGCSNLQPMDKDTLLKTRCGTVQYMAPEVLQKEGYNGFLADAWSCGVILYVMLTGYLPFDDDDMKVLFQRIKEGTFRISKAFTPLAKDLITKLLTTDPKRRLPVAEVLQHPWFKNISPSVSPTIPLIEPHRRSPPRLSIDTTNAAPQKVPASGMPPSKNETSVLSGSSKSAEDTHEVVFSTVVHTPEKGAGATLPCSGQQSSDLQLDAFQIMSHITQGALNPFAKQVPPNIEEKASKEKTWYMLVAGMQSSPIEELERVLKVCGCSTKILGKEIKGFICGDRGLDGLLTFKAYAASTVAGFTLVEIHCGYGNILHFREVVKALVAEFGPKLRSQELS